MKVVVVVISFCLQLVAVMISEANLRSVVFGGACLSFAVVFAAAGVIKYKSKLAYAPLLSGSYFLAFFVYHLFVRRS